MNLHADAATLICGHYDAGRAFETFAAQHQRRAWVYRRGAVLQGYTLAGVFTPIDPGVRARLRRLARL